MVASNNAAPAVRVLRNYINGEFVSGGEGVIQSIGPATGEHIADIPRSGKTEVNAAVAAAKTALPAWSATPLAERAQWLRKIADAIEAKLQMFAELETLDCGKPIRNTVNAEIPRAILNFRFFANFVTESQTQSTEMADALNITQRTPVGVAGLITPWNLPLYLLSWKVAPALVCGNTIVAKPSEITPLTAHALAEVIHEVGLPKGVFNLVHGYGADVGSPLVSHPDVNLVSFTGGTATGARVAAMAAPMFKKLSLELGGKNAALVFADCDWQPTIAECVRSAFQNSGQICLCNSRFLVQDSIYDKFVEDFVAEAKKLVIGDPMNTNTTTGSVSSAAHKEKIMSYVELAKQEGGQILLGGHEPAFDGGNSRLAQGSWWAPTVITGLDPRKSRVATEEVFGPVITIHKFGDMNEAIDMHNAVQYGLAGCVFTSNLKTANYVTRRMHTGMVWVNCWLHRDLRVPFGGIGASGVGREGGHHSIEFYSELKNICFKF